MTSEDNREWKEWSVWVFKELERLNSCYQALDCKMDSLSDKFSGKNDTIRQLMIEKNEAISSLIIAKNEQINNRVTTLYIKVAALGGTMGIIGSLLIILVQSLFRGKTP